MINKRNIFKRIISILTVVTIIIPTFTQLATHIIFSVVTALKSMQAICVLTVMFIPTKKPI